MCKVFAMPGIKKENISEAQRLVKEATKVMITTDKDGVGYAAITKKGDIYGEKWVKPEDAWKVYKNPKPEKPSYPELFLDENFGQAIEGIELNKKQEIIYNIFGKKTPKNIEDTVAIILHARKKTDGDVNIVNTHPFFEVNDKEWEDTAMIHNGQITNHFKLTKKHSTCDSETILHEYKKYAVNYSPENITTVAGNLRGLYTVAFLTSFYDEDIKQNQPILDIFKSNKPLVCGYVEELETTVFATTAEILEKSCEAAKMTLVGTFPVKDGYLIRIDAITGERLEDLVKFDLSPRTNTYTPGNYSGVGNPHVPKNVNTDKKDKVSDVKSRFEKDHEQLFDGYFEVGELTPNEKKALEELNSQNDPSIRALHLVQRAVGVDV